MRKLQHTLPDVEEGTLAVRVPFRERDRLIAADPETFYVIRPLHSDAAP